MHLVLRHALRPCRSCRRLLRARGGDQPSPEVSTQSGIQVRSRWCRGGLRAPSPAPVRLVAAYETDRCAGRTRSFFGQPLECVVDSANGLLGECRTVMAGPVEVKWLWR